MAVKYDSLEILFDGTRLPLPRPVDFTFAHEPPEPHVGLGKIGGDISFSFTAEIKAGDWERFVNPIRPSEPKWGQPSRRRRQKMRLAARRRNEAMQRQRAELEQLFYRVRAKQARKLLDIESKKLLDALATHPERPFFVP